MAAAASFIVQVNRLTIADLSIKKMRNLFIEKYDSGASIVKTCRTSIKFAVTQSFAQ